MLGFAKGEGNSLAGNVVVNAEARLGPKAGSRTMGKLLWREEGDIKRERVKTLSQMRPIFCVFGPHRYQTTELLRLELQDLVKWHCSY